jgi:hypothetical protein
MDRAIVGDGAFSVTHEGRARIYLFENQRYPSVTTVIERWLQFWQGSNQEEAYAAAMLGTDVHAMCAELSQNRRFAAKRIDAFPDRLQGYGYSWLKFMEALNPESIARERPLFSKKHRVAGRPDEIMEFNGRPHVVDYTIGSTRKAKRLQTAAYAMIYKEAYKDRRKFLRVEVPLKASGEMPTLRPHDDDNDKYVFLNFLNMYRWDERVA